MNISAIFQMKITFKLSKTDFMSSWIPSVVRWSISAIEVTSDGMFRAANRAWRVSVIMAKKIIKTSETRMLYRRIW